jgi:Asp-tRNA(Asn)/Glu-tRNA(Gln) amidotransferase B subunit
VLNRIITLHDQRVTAAPVIAKPATTNPKSKTRPKGKSPAEYRAEARTRDGSLAKDFERLTAMVGPESADLIAGDRYTATFFLDAISHANFPEVASKWLINELPRALDGRELEEVALPPSEFALLVGAVAEGKLGANAGKSVLAEMVHGKSFSAARAAIDAAPKVDLGAAIDAVIAANPEKATQYCGGKTGLLGFFVGQVMKKTPGADAAEVNKAVVVQLAKWSP